MTKTRVRFHLAQGRNFQNWQIKCGQSVEYYEPEDVVLVMENCKLRNQPTTAKRIFDGADKTVCAWIECDSVTIVPKADAPVDHVVGYLNYNPRHNPYWTVNFGAKADGKVFDHLITQGKRVAIPRN
mgnify:FL=1